MKEFEYALEKLYPLPATEEQLNIMGKDGWELTEVLSVKEHSRITETYYYYFKREIKPLKYTDLYP